MFYTRKRFLIVCMVAALLLVFAGCSDDDSAGEGGDSSSSSSSDSSDSSSSSASLVSTNTVTYDANGATAGSVPTDSGEYTNGQTVSIMSNTGSLVLIPAEGTAEAFKFGGWNTQDDGNGTDYPEDGSLVMGNSNITLYASWVPFAIRDQGPAGGWIFYDRGSFSEGWRYLEAAPDDVLRVDFGGNDYNMDWGDNGVDENGDDNSKAPELTAAGSGKDNTQWIIMNHSGTELTNTYQIFIAAHCYATNGYSNWFVPSRDTLTNMLWHLQGIGPSSTTNTAVPGPVGDFDGSRYWSSTEVGEANAVIQSTDTGNFWDFNKINEGNVRAVRAF